MFRITTKSPLRHLMDTVTVNLSPSVALIPSRSMVLERYKENLPKPKPFYYEDKPFTVLHNIWDHTYQRFDENTKLIVIEGQISVGKHNLAKTIAKEFGLHYMPDLTTDLMYINRWGYDMRELDPRLPEGAQSYDEKRFNLEPNHFLAGSFQGHKYRMRYANYIDALCHIMNTGQGVVIVRSPYSDCIFGDAMIDNGYISVPAKFTYDELLRHTLLTLLRPHLVIALDADIEATYENIKKKNIPYLTESKALTSNFLNDISKQLNHFAKTSSIHGHTLVYDWSEGGEVDVVLEDIQRLDFDKKRREDDPKFMDWNIEENTMDFIRYKFTTDKQEFLERLNICVYEAPEMWITAGDVEVRDNVYQTAPGMEYDPDWNPVRGDNVWFKRDKWRYWDPCS